MGAPRSRNGWRPRRAHIVRTRWADAPSCSCREPAPPRSLATAPNAGGSGRPEVQVGPGAAHASLFTLPATALFHDGKQPAVWVVKSGSDQLELRPVQVARYAERTIAISQGLNEGERVVWQGVHTVTKGEKVRVVAPLHPEDFAS